MYNSLLLIHSLFLICENTAGMHPSVPDFWFLIHQCLQGCSGTQQATTHNIFNTAFIVRLSIWDVSSPPPPFCSVPFVNSTANTCCYHSSHLAFRLSFSHVHELHEDSVEEYTWAGWLTLHLKRVPRISHRNTLYEWLNKDTRNIFWGNRQAVFACELLSWQ